ncbi:MAG: VWA domain-containing protein, partial [Coriobacteriaceae bacterium]|nr:VWA domain-containing protein [Coriobacteriaceae bacterium]
RHKVELDPLQKTVDVRIQLLAFGSGWAELTPLGPEPSPHQKQATLYNLLNPQSDHTMINGVLKYIRDSAKQSPGREVISIIVSDGLFADNLMAFKTVQNMPKNCFVCHINIGGFAGVPITLDYETVDDPVWLPTMLERILSSYLERRQL